MLLLRKGGGRGGLCRVYLRVVGVGLVDEKDRL